MEGNTLEILAGALASVGVLAFSYGLTRTLRRKGIDRRIETHVVASGPREVLVRRGERATQHESALATRVRARLMRTSLGAIVQERLVRAGLTLKPSDFILLQVAIASVAALVGALLFAGADSLRLLMAAVFAVVGFGAPLLFLSFREGRRMDALEKQLPQVIDSMAGTLQAGSTLPQSLEIIAREMLPPASVEFRRLVREMELGLSLTESLANLTDRVRSQDLIMLTSAIAIQNRVGGDLAGILKGISHTIRERLRIRNEINVLTAQGRISTYVITGLPVALFCFLYFLNYEYISKLFLPGITRIMLIGGIAGILTGFYSMRKIVAIEI